MLGSYPVFCAKESCISLYTALYSLLFSDYNQKYERGVIMKRCIASVIPVFMLLLVGCSPLLKPDTPMNTLSPASSTTEPISPEHEMSVSEPTPLPDETNTSGEVPPEQKPMATPAPDAKVYPNGNPTQDTDHSGVINPTPTPEPAPTEQTEAPLPTGDILFSGLLRSDTGTALNLFADWFITENENCCQLTIQLSLESYSLSVGERSTNTITINGNSHWFYSPALEVESDVITRTFLYTYVETLPTLPDELSLQISWDLRGSYSGKELPILELSGTVSLR